MRPAARVGESAEPMAVGRSYSLPPSALVASNAPLMKTPNSRYDWDVATTVSFMRKYGLMDDFKINVECNHATLSGGAGVGRRRWCCKCYPARAACGRAPVLALLLSPAPPVAVALRGRVC